ANSKLMEAAADILAGSKKTASSMPAQKLPGEVQDLGGPTNQDAHPMGDSEKIDATKGAKSATPPATKPSAASADTQNKPVGGKKTMTEEEMAHDMESLFSDDDTISEDFKSKAATIFEARVFDRVSQIEEETEARYAGMLEEAVETIKADLTEKVDDYLSYVVEQWMADNEIAVESGLRAELTEDFIGGLKNLFTEHYIDVPADKVDLVEELSTKVEELESKLNEEIETGIQLKKSLIESHKAEIAHEVCDGLTATQAEKVKALAESVDFSTEEEYKEKLETIRENYFPSGTKKADVRDLHEQVEDGSEKQVTAADPYVASVMQAISKTKI
ncbi:MAG: hypothetical protein EBS58_06905, partial [Micrococcales bacterium]|nr:hypothetical protein [Micrococcales bacterium]